MKSKRNSEETGDCSNPSGPDRSGHPKGVRRESRCAEPAASFLRLERAVAADWSEVRAFCLEELPRLDRRPFTVCIVSDAAMRRCNRDYRGHDEPTDVLAFPAGECSNDGWLGEIAISAQTALRQARRYRARIEDEIKLLALHGLLHLLGYDHETDGGRMRREEARWTARFRLPAGLIARAERATRPHRAGPKAARKASPTLRTPRLSWAAPAGQRRRAPARPRPRQAHASTH